MPGMEAIKRSLRKFMNIDFHHGTIYILSRLAGFEKKDANIIAYSSQYVDDACNCGTITFSNLPHAAYYRISSSHDVNLLEGVRAHLNGDSYNEPAWVPFHFLPGNCGRSANESDNDVSFIEKLVCVANSPIAIEMVEECIRHKNDSNSLFRLGITMHTYADTWAHQGFAGVKDEINTVHDINTGIIDLMDPLADNLLIPLLGHSRAGHCPDYPFLTNWSYTNSRQEIVDRNNYSIFIDAAKNIFTALQRFRNPTQEPLDLFIQDLNQISLMLHDTNSLNEDDRHQAWLENIKIPGSYSFGSEEPPFYPPKGKGEESWKYDALKTADTFEETSEFQFDKSFLSSNWKMFHDALQAHRFYVLHDLLPKYGILCCLPG
jgi:hypothetical protein